MYFAILFKIHSGHCGYVSWVFIPSINKHKAPLLGTPEYIPTMTTMPVNDAKKKFKLFCSP